MIFSMLSDVAVTAFGLSRGFAEANPVAVDAVETAGIGGLIVLKISVVVFAVACWKALPNRYGYPIPLALATPWLLATLVNVIVITWGVYFIS